MWCSGTSGFLISGLYSWQPNRWQNHSLHIVPFSGLHAQCNDFNWWYNILPFRGYYYSLAQSLGALKQSSFLVSERFSYVSRSSSESQMPNHVSHFNISQTISWFFFIPVAEVKPKLLWIQFFILFFLISPKQIKWSLCKVVPINKTGLNFTRRSLNVPYIICLVRKETRMIDKTRETDMKKKIK